MVTEAGSYLRLIDVCITQLKAQGPSRTCNESKEEEKDRGRYSTRFRTLTLSQSHIFALSHSHSHTLTLSHSHTLTFSHSHSHTPGQTGSEEAGRILGEPSGRILGETDGRGTSPQIPESALAKVWNPNPDMLHPKLRGQQMPSPRPWKMIRYLRWEDPRAT